nr:MAG TPA: hypothetical protein [Caudoviricetes sp.]
MLLFSRNITKKAAPDVPASETAQPRRVPALRSDAVGHIDYKGRFTHYAESEIRPNCASIVS